jgi:hypothetical protein
MTSQISFLYLTDDASSALSVLWHDLPISLFSPVGHWTHRTPIISFDFYRCSLSLFSSPSSPGHSPHSLYFLLWLARTLWRPIFPLPSLTLVSARSTKSLPCSLFLSKSRLTEGDASLLRWLLKAAPKNPTRAQSPIRLAIDPLSQPLHLLVGS